MFDNRSNIRLYDYEVQLDSIIKAICDLSFDIGTQIHDLLEPLDESNKFTIADMFNEPFLFSMGIRPDSLVKMDLEDGSKTEGYSSGEFFAYVSDHYNQTLFYIDTFLAGLKGSDILLINKKKSYFLCLGEKAKDRLIPSLKVTKILKQLILNLKSEKITKSLEKIETFENDFFYRSSIKCTKQQGQPLLPFINIRFLDFDKVLKEPVDIDDFWLNLELYSKFGIDLSGVDDYYILVDKLEKSELGLLVGGYLLLFANVNIVDFVILNKMQEYFWITLKKTYGVKSKKSNAHQLGSSVNDFIALREDKDLSLLLSYLKNNFYITDSVMIDEKFRAFFDSVILLEKLEYLDEYQFLMSSNSGLETALGVYSNVKKDNSYNLLHWINHSGPTNIDHYRSAIHKEKRKNLIHTLKPGLSYYFLEKYFEDFFESILQKNDFLYLSNTVFYERGEIFCEADFFVMTEKKFVYFEIKTKLTKHYILEFLKKSSSIIEKFTPMFEKELMIEFVLVGAYSDDSVKEYQYFVDENSKVKEEGYNSKRENLNSIPYYFFVPIPDKEGIKITLNPQAS